MWKSFLCRNNGDDHFRAADHIVIQKMNKNDQKKKLTYSKIWRSLTINSCLLSLYSQQIGFLSEAKIMKGFHHPNIVKLLGVCTKGEPFMVVEFHLYGKSYTLEELTGVSLSMEEFQLIYDKQNTLKCL